MQPKVQRLLTLFFKNFELESFAQGKIISSPDKNKGIFFLTKGTVKMASLSGGKNEITLNIYKPYSLFPMSLVFDQKDKHLYRSLTEVEGYFVPPKDFEEFIKKNPEVLFDLLKRIYHGLDGFFMLLETQLSGDAYLKTLTHLIIHAKRFGKVGQDIVTFDWQLTHKELASQTGLARESVTKEMRKLQKKGLIGYSGKKLFVYSLPGLEKERLNKLSS